MTNKTTQVATVTASPVVSQYEDAASTAISKLAKLISDDTLPIAQRNAYLLLAESIKERAEREAKRAEREAAKAVNDRILRDAQRAAMAAGIVLPVEAAKTRHMTYDSIRPVDVFTINAETGREESHGKYFNREDALDRFPRFEYVTNGRRNGQTFFVRDRSQNGVLLATIVATADGQPAQVTIN